MVSEATRARIKAAGKAAREGEMSKEIKKAMPAPSNPTMALSPDMGGVGSTDTLADFATGIKTALGSLKGGLQQMAPRGNPYTPTPEVQEQEHAQRSQEYAQAQKRSPWASSMGNIGTSMAVPVPGVNKLRAITEGADSIMKFLLSKAGLGAAEGAAVAGAQYTPKGESKLAQTATGGILGGGANAAISGAGKAYNAARPSSLFRGNQTPDELLARMQAAKGTETNLGQVLKSPRLAGTSENYLGKLLFPGATESSQRTAEGIRGRYGEELQSMTGGIPKDEVARILQERLMQIPREVNRMSKENYKTVNAISKALGGEVGTDEAATVAKQVLNEAKGSPRLATISPEGLRSELSQYVTKTPPLPPHQVKEMNLMNPGAGDRFLAELQEMYKPKPDTLKATNILKGNWGERAYSHTASEYEKGVASRMNRAIKRDIGDYIEKSGSKELKDAYVKAETDFKDNIAPLRAKEISRFTQERVSPDKIAKTFVKAEEPVLLAKLTDLLKKGENPEKGMNALRSGYFGQAFKDGKVNPEKFNTLFRDLNPQQIKDLGLWSKKAELERLGLLTSMNLPGLNPLFNPKSGHQAAEFMGVKKVFDPINYGPGQILNKLLTSEKTREKMVNKMLHPEQKDKEMLVQLGKLLEQNLGRTVAAQTAQANKEKR